MIGIVLRMSGDIDHHDVDSCRTLRLYSCEC